MLLDEIVAQPSTRGTVPGVKRSFGSDGLRCNGASESSWSDVLTNGFWKFKLACSRTIH